MGKLKKMISMWLSLIMVVCSCGISPMGQTVVRAEGPAYIDSWVTLQRALDEAGEGDVIELDRSLKAETENNSLSVNASQKVTIDLCGNTLDRALEESFNDGEVIKVYGELTLQDSRGGGRITGGFNTGNGGGIYVAPGGKLYFNSGLITGNRAQNGGGIYVDDGKVSVNGTVSSNYAADNGGGIYFNQVGHNEKQLIGGCLITDNRAEESGGGIYIDAANGMVSAFDNYNITGNKALTGSGGGIYLKNGTLDLQAGTVSQNSAGQAGGGLLFESGDGQLQICSEPVVKDNKAPNGNNILLQGDEVFEITDELSEGAKIDFMAAGLPRKVADCKGVTVSEIPMQVFTYNGGGNSVELKPDAVKEEIYADAKATVFVTDWVELQQELDELKTGSSIGLKQNITAPVNANPLSLNENKEITVDLFGFTLDRNLGESDDPKDNGNVFWTQLGTLTIRDSGGTGVITGGYAQYGGAISISNGSACVIEGGTIRGNRAKVDGGAINVLGSLTMTNGLIVENKASGAGGGIASGDHSVIRLSGVDILKNESGKNGGGLNVHLKEDGFIKDSNIQDNHAGESGGGLHLNSGETTLTISNTIIEHNRADGKDNGGGGAIQVDSGALVMEGGMISENFGYDGGGAYNRGGSLSLRNVQVIGNDTQNGGGGVNNKCKSEITGCEFKNNSSGREGGAIYNDSRLTMEKTLIEGSTARSKGGGGLCSYGSVTLTDCEFKHNVAETVDSDEGVGGAIKIGKGDASLTGGTFTDNEAKERGGAVYANHGTLTLNDVTIRKNLSYKAGSGVMIGDKGEIKVGGNTIVKDNGAADAKSDIFLSIGKRIKVISAFPAEACIGVALADDFGEGAFTRDYSYYNMSQNPSLHFFSSSPGHSVALDNEGEAMITKTNWGEIQAQIDAAENGGTVTVTKDYKASNSDEVIVIPEGKEIYLDLNGHTVDRGRPSSTEDGEVIKVLGKLHIINSRSDEGGKVTGGWSDNGGGVHVASGGELYLGNDGEDTKGNFVISGNRSKNGAGVYSDGYVKIAGGAIRSNTSDKNGGGIYTRGNVDIVGGEISSNSAGKCGGGILVDGSETSMYGGSITGNGTNEDFFEEGCGGGGVHVKSGELSLSAGKITGNHANYEAGGILLGEEGTLNVDGSPEVRDNLAGRGKNIVLKSGKKLIFKGPYYEGGLLDVSAESLSGPITEGWTDKGWPMSAITWGGQNAEDVLEVKDNELYVKTAEGHGVSTWGALQNAINTVEKGGAIVLQSDIKADGDDDRLKVEGQDREVVVDLNGHILDRDLYDDDSDDDGHVFEVLGGAKLTIRDTAGTGVITGGYAENGGGINISDGSTCVIEGGTIMRNRCDDDGGGIYVHGNLIMTGGTVFDNMCGESGGGIASGENSTLDLKNATIYYNYCNKNGGGMNVWLGADSVIENCTIKDNWSRSDGTGAGGLRLSTVEGRTLTLKNCEISGNRTDEDGGGIVVDSGNLVMEGGIITGNKADDCGGILNLGGTISLQNVKVTGNTATEDGGAGVNNKRKATLQNCEISGNSGNAEGGGVYNGEGANITLENCTINGNNAQGDGGGISSLGKVEIIGGSIQSNKTRRSGGGMRIRTGTVTISGDAVISNNSADEGGGGIYINNDGILNLKDNVAISENSAVVDGGGILVNEDTKAVNIQGAVYVNENTASRGDDINLYPGKKLTLTDTLTDANIGVSLEKGKGTVTKDYKKYNQGQDPNHYFHTAGDFGVLLDPDGEVEIATSNWNGLQGLIDGAVVQDNIICLDRDREANNDDDALVVAAGRELTIDLMGHTLNRNLSSRNDSSGQAIKVYGTLTLKDSVGGGRITGGYSEKGGAIFNAGTFILESGDISGNSAVWGGGIYNEGTLIIKGGTLSSNYAETGGGAIDSYGSGNTAISGGNITGNTAKQSGGAVYIDAGTVTVTGGAITGNRASEGNAGAVYVGNNGNLSLFGGTITGNEAALEGGAVLLESNSVLNAKDAPVVKDNTAPRGKNITLRPGTVVGVTGVLGSGAVLDVAAADIPRALTKDLTNSGNTGISAFTYNGNDGTAAVSYQDGELYANVNADVWASSWDELQGALDNAAEDQVIALNSDIRADGRDRLTVRGKRVTVDLCGRTIDRQLYDDDSDDDGHVFEVLDGSTLTIRDSGGTGVITGGYAENGGGINISDGSTCIIEGGTITRNRCDDDGGGIYVHGNLIMTGGAVYNNMCGESGGGIASGENSTLNLKNATINYNYCDKNGGGMNVWLGADSVIENCTIKDNWSRDDGTGAGGLRLATIEGRTLTLKNCRITGNRTDLDGGGIVVDSGNLVMDGGIIAGNTAEDCGGILNLGGNISLRNLEVSGNTATEDGGAGVNNKRNATLQNCRISGNSGNAEGGGIYNGEDATIDIRECVIAGNVAATDGGGMCTYGDATVTSTTFSGNEARKSGGAIRVHGGTTTLDGCTTTENIANEYGGGVYINNGGTLNLYNGQISSNTGHMAGGGVYVNKEANGLNVSGSLVVKNNYGGDIYLCGDRKISLADKLTEGADIGVALEGDKWGVIFTNGFESVQGKLPPSKFFTSSYGYGIYLNEDNGEAYIDGVKEDEYGTAKPFIDKNDNIRTDSLSPVNWMAGISGERYLTEFNIPGTHDSGTRNMSAKGGKALWIGADQAHAQTRYIDEQLTDGIRYFDIRLNPRHIKHDYLVKNTYVDDGKNLWICHGKTFFGTYYALNHHDDYLNLNEILDWTKDFLTKHPTETVIMSFSPETKDDNEDEVYTRLKRIMREVSLEINPSTQESFLYMEDGVFGKVCTRMPKLKDCRGKIVISDTKQVGGMSFGLENTVEFSPEGSYKDDAGEKVKHIKQFIDKYGMPDLLSDASHEMTPTKAEPEIKRYWYSIGTNGTNAPFDNPRDIAGVVHSKLFDKGKLFDQKGGYVGMVRFDCANEKVNRFVWDSNFKKDQMQYCSVTVKAGEGKEEEDQNFTVLKGTMIMVKGCIYEDPTNGDKFFAGWEAEGASGKALHYPGEIFEVTENVTFTAQWADKPKHFIQAIWKDGEDADVLRPDKLTVKVGENSYDLEVEKLYTGIIEDAITEPGVIVPQWDRVNITQENPNGVDTEGQYRYEIVSVHGLGYQIEMYHTPKREIEASGTIIWNDENDKDHIRPDMVTLTLSTNKAAVSSNMVEAKGSWKWDFGTLPMYADGEKIQYTLIESDIEGYSEDIEGFDVINVHVPDAKSLRGNVTWDDNDDEKGIRPDKVKIHLFKDGEEVASQSVENDEDGEMVWFFDITDMDDGDAEFTVKEDEIPGYSTTIINTEGTLGDFMVTNSLTECKHLSVEVRDEKAATCTRKGYTGDTWCLDCGQMIKKGEKTPIDPTNHLFDDGVVTVEPGQYTEGLKVTTCVRCHVTQNEIIPSTEEEAGFEDLLEDSKDESGRSTLSVNVLTDKDGCTTAIVIVSGEEIYRTVTDRYGNVIDVKSRIWVSGLHESYTYTGSAIKPEFHVFDGIRLLDPKKDYSAKFSNNKKANSTAVIDLKFKGSYKTTPPQSVSFKITPAVLGEDVTASDIAVAVSGKGKLQKPVPPVRMAESGKAVSKSNFEFTYRDSDDNEVQGVSAAGDYTVTLTPKNDSFTKSTTVAVTVIADKNLLLSKVSVAMDPKKYTWTGEPIEPRKGSYTLKLGKTTLKEDEDYEVTDIRYNVEPGKGVIEFRAVEGNAAGYAGIKTQTFTISKGRDIADKDIECTLSGNMPVRYAKGGAKPPVKVVDRDKTLREGKDYTLSYSKNTSVGNEAVVTVKGKGRYKGSKPVNFEVVKQDIETLSGNIVVEDVVESKKGFQNPKVTITDLDGKKLSKKDYSLGSDYTAPDEEGTVTVTLNGEGNYEGKMTVSYRYIKADIHLKKAKAGKLKNQIYSGKPIRLEEEDLKGVLNLNKALVPDEDFEVVTYNKNVKPGTAKVTLRGIGSFGGVRVLPFKIAPKQGDYRGAYIDGEWKTGS